ncbi:MAG: rubredoxin-like domain-containing protein [Rectinemataceae bacterium]
MANYVKCKSCGYIMEASKLGDRCPACGVSAKIFEPYDDKVSEKRRRLMDIHIHPIVVHFPQAFVAFLVPVGIVLLIGAGAIRSLLLDTATVLGVILPFAVAAAISAGLFDGKLRFRRLDTPSLRRKILLGSFFFVVSCASALIVLLTGLGTGASLAAFTLLNAIGLGTAVLLGLIGTPLFFAKFPG